jgi:hypothetical protein
LRTKDGLINCYGKIVVKPTYSSIRINGKGVAIAIETKQIGLNENGGQQFESTTTIFDVSGISVILPNTIIIGAFAEGLALAYKDGTYVYLDKRGKTQITLSPEIDVADSTYSSPEVFPFTKGLAGVGAAKDGMYLIDKQGNVTYLNHIYDENGLAIVENQGKYSILDRQGNYLFGPQDNYIVGSEGVFTVCPRNENEGKCSFINGKGKPLFDRQFEDASTFSEGLASVKINGKWGFIDKTGVLVIPPRFASVNDFASGAAAVEKEGQWGFINKAGRFIIPPKYDYVDKFDCELAYVKLNDVGGYINKKGKWVWREK